MLHVFKYMYAHIFINVSTPLDYPVFLNSNSEQNHNQTKWNALVYFWLCYVSPSSFVVQKGVSVLLTGVGGPAVPLLSASRIEETRHSRHDSLIEFPHSHGLTAAPIHQRRYVS